MIKTIVLAGDRNYTTQLETTIKSILYYNRDVKIYILNQDIMPDWFRKPRKIARMLGSDIIDVKLPEQTVFQNWKKQAHISSIAYARYFIPDYIQEDTVLYLDCDLLINDKLDSLFEQDIEEHYIAAIRDANGQGFNTGVLLINNEKWRQEKLKERLIEQSIITTKEVEEGRFEHFNGDQTIFNQVLQDDWLELGRAYNLQVGHDVVALYNNWQEHLTFSDQPVVIHFTTYRKPWTTLIANRYRDLWWQFHDLEWSQILQYHIGEFELLPRLDREFSCLTLTNSQDLEGIEELVTALLDVVFHIAAWTDMGDKLTKLVVYDNVRLHPQIVPPVLEKLKRKTDIYLDIHQGSEVESILRDVRNFGIPILSFSNTQHGMYNQMVFDKEDINLMIEAIKDYASNSRFLKDYNQGTFHCLIFTDTQDIEQLDYLAQYLPHVIFDVAAWTDMGPKLYELQNNYRNIRLHPAITIEKLKQIWRNKDILIVEGVTSRSGVGNDLFDGANSIKRIICPSHNAYARIEEIQEAVLQYVENRLILCMLGPTAKILSYNLFKKGYRVLDIGHIDSEYEWMKMGADTKVKFNHKHTAEHNFDQDIEFIEDETYNDQILIDLSTKNMEGI